MPMNGASCFKSHDSPEQVPNDDDRSTLNMVNNSMDLMKLMSKSFAGDRITGNMDKLLEWS